MFVALYTNLPLISKTAISNVSFEIISIPLSEKIYASPCWNTVLFEPPIFPFQEPPLLPPATNGGSSSETKDQVPSTEISPFWYLIGGVLANKVPLYHLPSISISTSCATEEKSVLEENIADVTRNKSTVSVTFSELCVIIARPLRAEKLKI